MSKLLLQGLFSGWSQGTQKMSTLKTKSALDSIFHSIQFLLFGPGRHFGSSLLLLFVTEEKKYVENIFDDNKIKRTTHRLLRVAHPRSHHEFVFSLSSCNDAVSVEMALRIPHNFLLRQEKFSFFKKTSIILDK